MDVFSWVMVQDWERGQDIIAVSRRLGGPGIWENFEYLVVRAREWLKVHGGGRYPRNVPRIPVEDRWFIVDHPA